MKSFGFFSPLGSLSASLFYIICAKRKSFYYAQCNTHTRKKTEKNCKLNQVLPQLKGVFNKCILTFKHGMESKLKLHRKLERNINFSSYRSLRRSFFLD